MTTLGKNSSTNSPEDASAAAVPELDPRVLIQEQGLRGIVSALRQRLRSGELGFIPVIIGLVIIWIVFQELTGGDFLSAKNLSDLSIEIVSTGMMSLGIVFVLLLGEIDLSIGSVSGMTSAVLAVTNVHQGWDSVSAILAAIVAGGLAGLLHGFFFAKIGVPAFVVSMAGLLGWNGLQLFVLGKDGSINLDYDSLVPKLTSTYFSNVAAAYSLALVAVLLYAVTAYLGTRKRQRAGVPARSTQALVVRTVALAVVAFGVAMVLNNYKGLPLALVIFLVFVVLLDLLLRRTPYGRKVFTVGGNVEAARRAGISVVGIRISVFMISGAMAAIGGIFATSMIASASQATGQSTSVLMNAIAAAVIGGTSLFGGRGSVYSAVIGVLVIQSIASGMGLKGISNSVQFMVTGGVLLLSVVIDSLSRRGQKASGRA